MDAREEPGSVLFENTEINVYKYFDETRKLYKLLDSRESMKEYFVSVYWMGFMKNTIYKIFICRHAARITLFQIYV